MTDNELKIWYINHFFKTLSGGKIKRAWNLRCNKLIKKDIKDLADNDKIVVFDNTQSPIYKDKDEFIKRKDWKLEELKGATRLNLLHPHYEFWQNYFLNEKEYKQKVALFMLCGHGKPYRRGAAHRVILNLLKRYNLEDSVKLFIVSNPGIVDIEYDNYYPFRWYEWPYNNEPEEIKKLYEDVTKERIIKFLKKHKNFEYAICYMSPLRDTKEICEQAFKDIGIKYNMLPSPEVVETIVKAKSIKVYYLMMLYLLGLKLPHRELFQNIANYLNVNIEVDKDEDKINILEYEYDKKKIDSVDELIKKCSSYRQIIDSLIISNVSKNDISKLCSLKQTVDTYIWSKNKPKYDCQYILASCNYNEDNVEEIKQRFKKGG